FAQERQIPFIADMNGDFRDGYAAVPMSNWPDKRASAAICYLDGPVRRRSNLALLSDATVTHLLFDGRRAVGVKVAIGDEERPFDAAERIVRAGALHTRALLMRSGIGPAADLRDLGIDVCSDLPGVGGNLSNHSLMFVAIHLKPAGRQSPALRPHPTTL